MLKYQDVKDALLNEHYAKSLPTAQRSEALKRLINTGVVQLQRYAVVIHDRKKYMKDFDNDIEYRYVCLKHDGGIVNLDKLENAPLFTWDEIPDDFKENRVAIEEDLEEVTAEEVADGLASDQVFALLSDLQHKEVLERIRLAGLLKDSGLYYIHIVPEDENSFLNVEDSGAISLDDCCQTKYVKTTFTQDEIDNDQLLKALEQFKEEV